MCPAYVLMRVYNPTVATKKNFSIVNEYRFFYKFKRAIKSLQKNTMTAKLVICDDTPTGNKQWAKHNKKLLRILKKHGFQVSSDNLYFVETNGGKGSSLAAWKLKKEFLKLTDKVEDAFAVLLDQDDELEKDAIKSIAGTMGDAENGVVISKYVTCGDKTKDITNDGGKSHNEIVEMHERGRSDLCYLSTIGWTKAFSRGAIKTMTSDFEAFFVSGSVEEYFLRYKAYEDFLDFYMLINKNIKLLFNKNVTHRYYKHGDSITSTPKLEAFSNDRSVMLQTLSKICCKQRKELVSHWDRSLVEFLKKKITEIEDILNKYRTQTDKGDVSKNIFKSETYDGWFAESICSNNEFTDKYINRAVEKWAESSRNKTQSDENVPSSKKCKSLTIIQYAILIVGFIAAVAAIIMTIRFGRCDGHICSKILKRCTDIVISFATILTAFYTVLKQLRGTLEIEINKEYAKKKLYFNEFDELLRHLIANLRVMVEVRRNLTESKTPNYIHFENLKWVNTSALFSEENIVLLKNENIDDFLRVKINIRNMNNSAQWLKENFQSKMLPNKELLDMLDWEITRMLAYYINFLYMKEHDFSFPNMRQVMDFSSRFVVNKILRSIFLKESEKEKIRKVTYYLNRYYTDREIQRSIVYQS